MYALCICTCICICICICVCISIRICICVCIGICICIPPCLRFAGSELCGPPAKPVLARRLKCRCRLPASFLPLLINCIVHCEIFSVFLHVFSSCLSHVCLQLYLYFCVILCVKVLLHVAANCPAPGHALGHYCRRSWEKLATRLNFAQKIGAHLLQVGRSRVFQDLQHWLWQHRHG